MCRWGLLGSLGFALRLPDSQHFIQAHPTYVKKADREEQNEWNARPTSGHDRNDQGDRAIQSEAELDGVVPRPSSLISGGLRVNSGPEVPSFRGPDELDVTAEQTDQNRAAVVDRKSDAERHHGW